MAQSTLEIVEVRADDPAAIDAAYDVAETARHADLPDFPPECRFLHKTSFAVPMPAHETRTYLALDGDVPVGLLRVELPRLDNLDKSHVEVQVRPEYRRRGIGRALAEHGAAVARAAGRTAWLGFSPDEPAPVAFNAALGLTNALTDARRRLSLADVDDAALDRLEAEGLERAAGYRLELWGSVQPEEYLEDLAALDSSFIAETPMGEMEYEPQKVTADRLRRQYEVYAAWGTRRYEAGLVHEASGRLVAWTAMRLAKTVDWHAWQLITLVHPAHRGHRLGIVAKVANLRAMRAAEPAVTTVDTFNAASNSYMIAINEAMGFRFMEHWSNWQGPV